MTPPSFSKIDSINIGEHSSLTHSDICYFLYEYTSGNDYSYSATNTLISNLKKLPSKKRTNPAEFQHKLRVIRECSDLFSKTLSPGWLRHATLVPVPSSKIKSHPEYDDRMLKVCQGISTGFDIDVRELVIQSNSTRATHECATGERPSINDIISNYTINEEKSYPLPKSIGIFDDVLTTGKHFKAMQKVLSDRFPDVPIYGIFIARRVFESPFSIENSF